MPWRAQAVCKALREREAALLTVQALEEELEKKRRGMAALEEEGRAVFGGDKGKTRRVAGLNADKAALEARAFRVTCQWGVWTPVMQSHTSCDFLWCADEVRCPVVRPPCMAWVLRWARRGCVCSQLWLEKA